MNFMFRSNQKPSIIRISLISASMIVLFIIAIKLLYTIPRQNDILNESLTATSQQSLQQLAGSLRNLLFTRDLAQVYETVDSTLAANTSWLRLQILSRDGRQIYPLTTWQDALQNDDILIEVPVDPTDVEAGLIRLVVNFTAAKSQFQTLIIQQSIFQILVIMATLTTVIWLTVYQISRPLKQLTRAFKSMSEGDYDCALPDAKTMEVDQIVRDFAEARREIQQYQQNLVQLRDDANRSNQAKSNFISRMSHELRTPLNSILGFSEMLGSDTDLKPEQLARLGVITTSGQHLLRLIDDLLDIAGLQSEKLQVTNEHIAISALFEDCQNLIAPMATLHQVTVKFADIPADLPAISADATRLRQVLLNLLSNAIKYNRKHGWVTVTVTPAEEMAHGLRIEVEDSGAGLSEQECSRVFMPFERLGRHASAIDGTGIGLSISKELVELMHGRIGVKSIPGHGACFWIELPTATPDTTANPTRNIDAEHIRVAGDVDKKLLTILVVEDNQFNQKLIQAQLAALGFSCTLAADGLEALERYQHTEFDLILTDIKMPNMDGLELTRRIRALEADNNRHTRIIGCSANAMESDQLAAVLAGTDDYIVKPVSKADLERAILNAMRSHQNS